MAWDLAIYQNDKKTIPYTRNHHAILLNSNLLGDLLNCREIRMEITKLLNYIFREILVQNRKWSPIRFSISGNYSRLGIRQHLKGCRECRHRMEKKKKSHCTNGFSFVKHWIILMIPSHMHALLFVPITILWEKSRRGKCPKVTS